MTANQSAVLNTNIEILPGIVLLNEAVETGREMVEEVSEKNSWSLACQMGDII